MEENKDDLFKVWAGRLERIYQKYDHEDGASDKDESEWCDVWEKMQVDFPYISVTWMDPRCGCCSLESPALLAFDNQNGPVMFEIVYPAYKPTHVHYFGEE